MSQRLGELLIRENLISLADLQQAQEDQRENGERLGSSLVKLGMIEIYKDRGVSKTSLGVQSHVAPVASAARSIRNMSTAPRRCGR